MSRTLLALEAIQNRPGITAGELGERLGVSERAARRHVALLREAGIPIDSTRGPYGGYRAGRGLRLPPLMFSPAEALGLAMAVLEGMRRPRTRPNSSAARSPRSSGCCRNGSPTRSAARCGTSGPPPLLWQPSRRWTRS